MSRGYFAIGVYHAKTEVNIGTLWRSASAFGAAFVFTVGARYRKQAADTTKTDRHTPLFHFTDMDDLLSHLPNGCPLVAVELLDKATPLNRFTHLERDCFLLGAEDHGLPPEVIAKCHRKVVIPHAAQCLNVAVAGSIVMYDRAAKGAA